MSSYAVVLAAGLGTRMKSDLPKVLHLAAGRTLLGWVLSTLGEVELERIVVVVGHRADLVRATLPSEIFTCVQAPLLGTGHATSIALDHLREADDGDAVLVVPGDAPLVSSDSLRRLIQARSEGGAAVAMLTAVVDDPTGYGRVVRGREDAVMGIVEHRDASPSDLAIREINAGMYAFEAGSLRRHLSSLTTDNVQGEYYLTDVVGLCVADLEKVVAVVGGADEVVGVNDLTQLAEADRLLRRVEVDAVGDATVCPTEPEDEVI